MPFSAIFSSFNLEWDYDFKMIKILSLLTNKPKKNIFYKHLAPHRIHGLVVLKEDQKSKIANLKYLTTQM